MFVKLVTLEFSPFVFIDCLSMLTLSVAAVSLSNTKKLVDFETLLGIVLSR